MSTREAASDRLTRLTGLKLKDRVRVMVPVTGTTQQREIVGTITASQVHEIPSGAEGTEPWGSIVVKELGANLFHSVDHHTVTKVAKTR